MSRWQQLSNDEWIWYWLCQRRWNGKQRICCPADMPLLTFAPSTDIPCHHPTKKSSSTSSSSSSSSLYTALGGVVNWLQVSAWHGHSIYFAGGKQRATYQ
jgi:hypothetical protein